MEAVMLEPIMLSYASQYSNNYSICICMCSLYYSLNFIVTITILYKLHSYYYTKHLGNRFFYCNQLISLQQYHTDINYTYNAVYPSIWYAIQGSLPAKLHQLEDHSS